LHPAECASGSYASLSVRLRAWLVLTVEVRFPDASWTEGGDATLNRS